MNNTHIVSKEELEGEYEFEWPKEAKDEFVVKAKVKETGNAVKLRLAPCYFFRRDFDNFDKLHKGTVDYCLEWIFSRHEFTGERILKTCKSTEWTIFVEKNSHSGHIPVYAVDELWDFKPEKFWGVFSQVSVVAIKHSGYFYCCVI